MIIPPDQRTDVRLAIVGSTEFGLAGSYVQASIVIGDAIEAWAPGVVISGGAPGIDEIAADMAKRMGYSESDESLLIFRPRVYRWEPPSGDGFKWRNDRIARECTHLLRISRIGAETYGSGWTADRAELTYGRNVKRVELP